MNGGGRHFFNKEFVLTLSKSETLAQFSHATEPGGKASPGLHFHSKGDRWMQVDLNALPSPKGLFHEESAGINRYHSA